MSSVCAEDPTESPDMFKPMSDRDRNSNRGGMTRSIDTLSPKFVYLHKVLEVTKMASARRTSLISCFAAVWHATLL